LDEKMSDYKKILGKTQTRYVLESSTSGGTSAGSVSSLSKDSGMMQRRQGNLLTPVEGKETVTVPVTQKPRQGPLRPQTGAGQHRDKKKEQKAGKEKHRKPFAEGVAEDTNELGYHTRVRRGDFRPSKYGEDEYNYLHDLMNTSGDGSGPMLVTIDDKKIARQIAAMYGGDVEETGLGTYRIVQRRGNSPMGNEMPKLTGVAEGNPEYDDEAGMAESNLHTLARAVQGLMDTIDEGDNLPEWCQEKIAKAEQMLVTVWDYMLSQKEQGIDPEQSMAEGPNDGREDNFTIDDIKRLEKIRDLETLKAQAKELIKGKPAKRMKPEKISWFYNHIDTLRNPLAVIKMMYDLMLAGEGHRVIGSKNSMSPNSYRSRFGEEGVAEEKIKGVDGKAC